MDVKINETADGKQTTLEYNVIGGVLDFYFLAGSETDPTEVAKQYAKVVGTPAEMPYWAFGLHQCRYGYRGAYLSLLGHNSTFLAVNSTFRFRECCRRYF